MDFNFQLLMHQDRLLRAKVIKVQQNKNWQQFIGQLLISDHMFMVDTSLSKQITDR